jgi:hypothetical protein
MKEQYLSPALDYEVIKSIDVITESEGEHYFTTNPDEPEVDMGSLFDAIGI